MTGEGRLLILFVERAIFDAVLRRQNATTRSLGKRNGAIAGAHLAIGELHVGSVEAQPLRHLLAQLDAGRVQAGGGIIGAPLAARSGRGRKVAVAKDDAHLRQRHAHHFRRGLGEDGIGAGADVGHVSFDGQMAVALQPDARGRLGQLVVAEARRHTHADQPFAVARLARLGVAARPAEFLCSGAQAFDQMTLRKGPVWLGRIDLRIVDDAQFHRVHA